MMDWSPEALYGKARLYVRRAHDEQIDSALFGFWMSLSIELLARASLAHIHPALLADPKEPDNIHYVFGVIPKANPKSIAAKAVFARCSVLITDFTDKMSGQCLILADRRNAELHSGAAAFENIDNSKWLPAAYEILTVFLKHMGKEFADFLGSEHGRVAEKVLKDRRDTIKREVQGKLAETRKFYAGKSESWKLACRDKALPALENWIKANRFRRTCACPACGLSAGMSGESVGRSPVRVDEVAGAIKREVRLLPNVLICPFCRLRLDGFQEMNEAGLGNIYQIEEDEDPIEFFGIVPEEHVDVKELIRSHFEGGYQNE